VLIGLTITAAAHVGLAAAVETVRPAWRDPDYGHRLPLVQHVTQRPLVVALGSSRTQMGFRPATMGLPNATVINFGAPGAGPYHHALTFARLDAAGVRPDFLLVEILPAALTQEPGAEASFRPQAARLSAADVGRVAPYCDHSAGLWTSWAVNRLNSWFSLRFSLVSHALPTILPWQTRQDLLWKATDHTGWLPYPFDAVTAADRQKGLARTRGEYAATLSRFHLTPGPDRALHDLVAAANRRGIRVAFYLMPESPTFRSWYPAAARAALNDYLARLSWECGVPVFDATDWLGEDSFSDGHHLLKAGATAFGERFGRECLGPWVETGR
jgi:hypothetical protein